MAIKEEIFLQRIERLEKKIKKYKRERYVGAVIVLLLIAIELYNNFG